MLKILLYYMKCEIRSLSGSGLDAFLDRGGVVDGVRYPTPYVAEQGEAWGLYKDNELLGGYVLISKGPLRATTFLAAQGVHHHYDEADLIELGGLWIEKSYRSRKFTTLIWLHMIKRARSHKKPFMIWGYNLSRSGLGKMYSAVDPHVLFRGNLRQPEGMSSHVSASIEVARTSKALYVMSKIAVSRIRDHFLLSSSEANKKVMNEVAHATSSIEPLTK